MDYRKIKLENERCGHVTKRLNRLGAWGFFKVLYRDSIWRLFAFNIIMLICIAPIIVFYIMGEVQVSSLQASLPLGNSASPFAVAMWTGVEDVYSSGASSINYTYGLYMALGALALSFMFSGGFAVIRDSFWTGKLETVGVLNSFGRGIAAAYPYGLVASAVFAGCVYGIFCLYSFLSTIAVWLAVVATIFAGILALFIVAFMMVLCSVAVTYKQSVGQTIADAWRLLWLNIFPNVIHVLLALLPIGIYFILGSGLLASVFYVLLLMFGGIYFPLVWQSFMMKTFALFHPVEPKKKENA